MKKVMFSLLSVVMLVAMMLPAIGPPVVQAGEWPSINMQINPSMGALIYIWDVTDGNWAIDKDTGLPVNGISKSPSNISVAGGHCYDVWVEKAGWIYTVTHLPPHHPPLSPAFPYPTPSRSLIS